MPGLFSCPVTSWCAILPDSCSSCAESFGRNSLTEGIQAVDNRMCHSLVRAEINGAWFTISGICSTYFMGISYEISDMQIIRGCNPKKTGIIQRPSLHRQTARFQGETPRETMSINSCFLLGTFPK